jgi:hypothetical protein
MVNLQKIQPGLTAWLATAGMVVALLRRYGKKAVEWVLMKCYAFFIIGSTAK